MGAQPAFLVIEDSPGFVAQRIVAMIVNIAADIAQQMRKEKAPPLLIKKIYVLAAFEVDSYKQRVFDASMSQITGEKAADAASKTLNSLITTDINTSTDKALNNPWKGAEAIHFYLLCQR